MEEWNIPGLGRRGLFRSIREFHVALSIQKILAMPCTNQHFSCRWKMPREISKPYQGETPEVACSGNEIIFDCTMEFLVKIRSELGAREYLDDCVLSIEVRSNDPDITARRIGVVDVNLSLFAGIGKRTNRYLLQDSKCNGMLELSLWLKQASGDPVFMHPRGHNFYHVEGVSYSSKFLEGNTGLLDRISTIGRKSTTEERNTLLETLPELDKELGGRMMSTRYALPSNALASSSRYGLRKGCLLYVLIQVS
uniref:C2 NT-type domain-containing protein n=1 Tax=Rhodosorus marinus TaxID=101924 RepID=A0A7S2ZCV7_9RHOD|mmetsp:Transcript_13855/g.55878  ORF Transcript_13855/g.55878 Transcript_13855/m.55878 type:complete len:252 (+) Transcript_13855:151-906(+)